MANTEEVGVKLTAQNEAGFVSAMGNAQGAVSKFVSQVSGGTSSVQGFNLANLTLATTLGNLLSNAIQSASSFIVQQGENAILAAGRLQEMTTVDEMLGSKAGITSQAVDDQINKVRKLGIEGSVAADTVAQFIRYQLDMAKSTDLARVAQDAAVISNSNSTETLSRLIDGVMTGDTEILRTSGIMVDMNAAYDTYAKQLGKTTAALTEDERVQARLNSVIAAGANIAGAYETAMKEPYKIMGSMPRVANDLAVAIGGPLQSAFGTGLTAAKSFLESLTASFSEGGSLYPSMVTFGQNLNDLVKNLIGVGAAAGQAGEELASKFGLTMDNLNSKGFAWGYNIINQVVGGMLQGAIDSVGILTQIGAWIGSWFEAHSPPKILPDLDKWGAAAMNAYLKGWTQGDFTVFGDISAIIESSLRSTAGTQDTGLIPAIIGSRSAIAQAIEQVQSAGEVTQGILNRLYQTVGAGNPAMQAYLKTTLELGLANAKVAAAQDALNAITKKYNDLLAPLNAKVAGLQGQEDIMSNNQRISQLSMVLSDKNATEQDKAMARAEIEKLQTKNQIIGIQAKQDADVSAAQTKLDAATAEQKAAQAQADLAKAQIQLQTQQNDLVKQQIALLEQLAKAAQKAGGSGVGGLPSVGALPKLPTTTKLPQVIDLIQHPSTASTNPFTPIMEKMDLLTTKINDLHDKWKWLTDFIGGNSDQIVKGAAAFGGTYIALAILGSILAITVAPVTALMLAISLLVATIVIFGAQAKESLYYIGGIIVELFLKWRGIIADWCANIINTIAKWGTDLITNIGTTITDWGTKIGKLWDDTKTTISTKSAEIWTVITTWAASIAKAVTDKIADLVTAGGNLVEGIRTGISNAWDGFMTWIKGLVNSLPEVIKKALGISSPSTVFAGIGQNMMLGLAQGILDGARFPNVALSSIAGMVSAPGAGMYAPPSISHSYSPSWNLTVMSNNSPEVVAQSFGLMRILAG